jgi:RecA-family ATPase
MGGGDRAEPVGSWLALGLCVAVASGGLALGKNSVEPGAALYLGLEDSARLLNGRLRKVLDDRTAPKGLEFMTEWPGRTNAAMGTCSCGSKIARTPASWSWIQTCYLQ